MKEIVRRTKWRRQAMMLFDFDFLEHRGVATAASRRTSSVSVRGALVDRGGGWRVARLGTESAVHQSANDVATRRTGRRALVVRVRVAAAGAGHACAATTRTHE